MNDKESISPICKMTKAFYKYYIREVKFHEYRMPNASLERILSYKAMEKCLIKAVIPHYLNALVLLNSHTDPIEPLCTSGM